VKGISCYTHFVTDIGFENQDFQIEFEVDVPNSEYLYLGLINNLYSVSKDCCCTNPSNAFYYRNYGAIIINRFVYKPDKIIELKNKKILGMKVYLNKYPKQVGFYFPEMYADLGYYDIKGDSFRVFFASCMSSKGTVKILNCISLN